MASSHTKIAPHNHVETVPADHIPQHPPSMDAMPPWWKQKGLRELYLMMPILFLGSTTLGFDGSLMNNLQSMIPWQDFFHDPTGARLGLYGAMPGMS